MATERTTEHEVDVEPTALFTTEEGERLRARWETVQASFIDEPRESVAEADRLVSDLVDRITDRFTAQRQEMEGTWERGEEVDTETLRLTFQRYRTFFERLLRV